MQIKLTLFLFRTFICYVPGEPLMTPQVIGIAHFGYGVLFHFILCKPLLTAQAKEILVVVTQPIEHF
jgi:hypothetical protein